MKITKAQITKIKIAQKQLGIDETTKLQQYVPFGVTSCTQMDYNQAEELLKKYAEAGFKTSPQSSPKLGKGGSQYGFGKLKYINLDKRGKPFAHSSKLRKIEKLWRLVSDTKTDKSLRIFIENRTGISHITMLTDKDARIIITALQNMNEHRRGAETQR